MKIKDWHKFQHFKDRRPLWIKLYRDILDNHDISLISDFAFRVLVGCWLLASEDETRQGILPSIDTISFRLRQPKSKIDKALQELSSFLIQDDIKAISSGYQPDALETETEIEKENKEKDDFLVFDSFRMSYPGTKKGAKTEFNNYKKKHKDWREVLPLLQPAINKQMIARRKLESSGVFVPSWKHLQTWINQRCWEEEPEQIPDKATKYEGGSRWHS